MNTHDIDIDLPPLPEPPASICPWVHSADVAKRWATKYALAAIEADRKYLAAEYRKELDKESTRNYELRMENAQLRADRKRRGEPVAFSYELATTRSGDGEYIHWSPRLSYSMPDVPEGSIRNLRWLYDAPQPASKPE